METGLERLAAKARSEAKLRFTSLTHHVTRERVWENLCQIPNHSAPGCDGQTVPEAKEEFGTWVEPMLQSMHRQGYQAPPIRRVYIPKPGKQEKRPLGVPCVTDRALQRSTAQVLSAIYEQDFLSCSFGGRPGLSAHHALATLNEVIAGRKVGWVLEADLKNFFGSLDHGWLLRFVELRVGDPRIISLIRRWLKAGVLEDDELHPNEEGTPQGGSITPLTQKTTSSLSAGLRGGGSCRCLILDANSITLMSHGAIHASTEGKTIERGLSVNRASDEPVGGSRHIVARERDFIASCLSLSRASRTARATAQGRRACAADHLQNPRQRDSRLAHVCRRQRPHLERGCDARHRGVGGARATRWLSGCASAGSVSNTPSIDYSPPSSSRSTRYSFPIACEARVRLRR